MKKQTKIMVVLLSFVLVFGVLMFAISAETSAVAKIGNKEYATLEDAITDANAEDTVILTNDVVVTSSLKISKVVNIDLNGYTLDGATGHEKGQHLFNVSGDGKLNITGRGTILSDNSSAFFIYDKNDNAVINVKSDIQDGIVIYTSKAPNSNLLIDLRAGVSTFENVKIVTSEGFKSTIAAVGIIRSDAKIAYGGTLNFTNSNIDYNVKESSNYPIKVIGPSTLNIKDCNFDFEKFGIWEEGYVNGDNSVSLATVNIENSVIRQYFTGNNGKQGQAQMFEIKKNTRTNVTNSTLVSSWRLFIIGIDSETNAVANFKDSTLASGVLKNSLLFRGFGDITVDHCNLYFPYDLSYKTVNKTENGQGLLLKNGCQFSKAPRASNSTSAYNLEEGMEVIKCGTDGRFQYVLAPVGTAENPYTTIIDDDFDLGLQITQTPAVFDEKNKVVTDASKPGCENYPNILYGGNIKDGQIGIFKNSSGNFYYKHYYEKDKHIGPDPFGGFTVGKAYPIQDYSYFTFDYDLATDNVYCESFQIYLCVRMESASTQTQLNTSFYFETSEDGKKINILDSARSLIYTIDNVPYDWIHMTWVLEADPVNITDSIFKLFINGDEVYSGKCLKEGSYYVDILRWAIPGPKNASAGESFIFDNVNIRVFDKGYTGDLEALMDGTKKLVDCKESIYKNNYQFPLGDAVAEIDGVKYDNIDKAVKAAKEGDVIKLIADIKKEYFVTAPFVVDTNGFEFNTDSELYYYTADGNVRTYLEDVNGDKSSTVYWFNRHGNSDYSLHPFGAPIRFPDYLEITVEKSYIENGKFYEFVGWTSTEGYPAEPEQIASESNLFLNLYPVYSVKDLAFSANVDGKQIQSSDMADLFNVINSAKNKVSIKLESDIINKEGFSITPKAGIILDFDFNGHKVALEKKGMLFVLNGDVTLNVYSSLPGGAFFNKDAVNGNGGILVYACNDGNTVNIGKFGDISGDNFAVYSPCVVDTNSSGKSIININGGKYYRNVQDYSGFLIARNASVYNVKDAYIVNAFNTSSILNPTGNNCEFNFNNCVIMGDEPVTLYNYNGTKDTARLTFNNTEFYNVKFNTKDGVASYVNCISSLPIDKIDAKQEQILIYELGEIVLNYNDFGEYKDGYNYIVSEHKVPVKKLYKVVSEGSSTVVKTEGLMQNLTLYSDFTLNLYIPVDKAVVGIFSRHGENLIESAKRVLIGDKEYFVISNEVGAYDIDRNADFFILNSQNGNKVEKVTLKITDYADAILSGKFSLEVKNLMKAMLNYTNEAHKLFAEGAENAVVANLLKTYGNIALVEDFGEVFDVASMAEVITAAQLNLDASPDFVFTLANNFAGTVTLTVGERVETFTVEAVGADAPANVVRLSNVRMYELNDKISIKADGVVGEKAVGLSGNYNLATYIKGLSAEATDATFAKALFTYSDFAKAYNLKIKK